jgi:hypothetical protein
MTFITPDRQPRTIRQLIVEADRCSDPWSRGAKREIISALQAGKLPEGWSVAQEKAPTIIEFDHIQGL